MKPLIAILIASVISCLNVACQSTASNKPMKSSSLVTTCIPPGKPVQTYSHTQEVLRDLRDVVLIIPVTAFEVYAWMHAGSSGPALSPNDPNDFNHWLFDR